MDRRFGFIIPFAALTLLIFSCEQSADYAITGELKQWHRVTLTFNGPASSEDADPNPFTDYRLLVRFSNGDKTYAVPGYFAADGNAGETSATSGNQWRVHFSPDEIGTWDFEVSFRRGDGIAVSGDPEAGQALKPDGILGTFEIAASDKAGVDFRGKGRIGVDPAGKYLQYSSDGSYFLKGGADSPENFLAYHEIDQTSRFLAEAREGEAAAAEEIHQYAAHVADWSEDSPTWQNGKGKGIIGAINYLASTGMNSIYFLTMNINGDGKDVWPYTSYEERSRFDCSKLDQWEVIFSHMESLGILMHVVLQETENERLLDDGDTGPQRKLYHRELIARFGHHNALIWNLGEENGPAHFSPNGQTADQQKAMASHLKLTDPYQHPVVIHTHSTKEQKDELLPALLGFPFLDGLSFQINKREHVHEEIIKWRGLAAEAGQPWLIGMDEIGFWYRGVMPDDLNPDHDTVRHEVLWGSLMAGSAGVEWYFGAHYDHNDLGCEDWRSRANMWDQTRHALDFFNNHLRFWEMEPRDELFSLPQAYCLANPGKQYAVYLPKNTAGDLLLDLGASTASFTIRWFSPKNGGVLMTGDVAEVKGPGQVNLGPPPGNDRVQDWAAVINKVN